MTFRTLNRHSQARGFTVVEILIAMAIFGVVIAAIYSSWTAILRAARTGQEAAAQVQRERIAARTIEQALGGTRSFQADQLHYGFMAENGEGATLSFVAHVPQSFPRSGRYGDFDVRRLVFSLEGSSFGTRQLVLRQTPILMDVDEDEVNHPVVLARGVKEFKMDFWDQLKGEWIDEWLQTNQLPKLVRFTLHFGGTDPDSPQVESEITRIVALPSVMVPGSVQLPPNRSQGPLNPAQSPSMPQVMPTPNTPGGIPPMPGMR